MCVSLCGFCARMHECIDVCLHVCMRERVTEGEWNSHTEWSCNAWSNQKRRCETSFLTDTSILSFVKALGVCVWPCNWTYQLKKQLSLDLPKKWVHFYLHLSFSLSLFSINAEEKSVIPIYRSSRCLAERSVLSFLPCSLPKWKQEATKGRGQEMHSIEWEDWEVSFWY